MGATNTVTAYYNEFDPKAAAWLRELIKGGHIADGEVDTRSIEDIAPNDLNGFTQHHFFAGIGGWSYALRLANWPDNKPAWTGSCPCQPFSVAGKGDGFNDERHLWPAFHWLIKQYRPNVIFGEQVANALPWLDLVSTDLEGEGYTVGAAIIGAHSVGAPHMRQRLYWMADAESFKRKVLLRGRESRQSSTELRGSGGLSKLANANGEQRDRGKLTQDGGTKFADTSSWGNAKYLNCRDGKQRPVEPGSFPLAHGVPNRVGLLRGYGNAIVSQAAAAFICASTA